ncbi:MAG TPA: VCBS repeat-containing protein, partial [Thermoanaerobaculia bacterium]
MPGEPAAEYHLGVLAKLAGDVEGAIGHFERAAAADGYFAAPRFQLAAAYRQAGRGEDAERAMAAFRELKAMQADDAVPEDPDWSYYSELYDPLAAAPAPAPPAAEPAFAAREIAALGAVGPAGGGVALLEADGEPGAEIVAWTPSRVAIFAGDGTLLADSTASPVPRPLPALAGLAHLAAGDFDDDGRADLALATAAGARLWRNGEDGWGEVALPESVAGRPFDHALWLDYDHDYDVDLFLFGERPALVRNVGGGDFADATERFPFAPGRATAAVALDLVADTPGQDLVVAHADGPGVLYRDLLGGRYEARPLPDLPAGAGSLAAADLDNDGWTDLAAATPAGVLFLGNDRRQGLGPFPESGAAALPAPFALADVEARGILDVVTAGGLLRNLGFGRLAAEPRPLPPRPGGDGAPLAGLAAADLDGDGLPELVALTAHGRLLRLANRTETANGRLVVALGGVKNLELAPAAEI